MRVQSLALLLSGAVLFSPATRADELLTRPPEAVLARFMRIDRNGDKQLSLEEFRAVVGAVEWPIGLRDFRLIDRNTDDQLSLDEYWSLPTLPLGQRGPIPDPMAEIVNQFVSILDQLLKGWDQQPERTIPVAEFLAEFSKALQEPQTDVMYREADPDQNGHVSRAEARRFVEIQSGVRRSDGKLLRMPDGRVVQLMQFVYADQNQDDRLDEAEYLGRTSSGEKARELYEKHDSDNDGFVTWVEWSQARFQDPIHEFRRIDSNLDAQLEPAELLAGTPEWCKISAKIAFPAFDRGRDGKLSLDEFRLTFQANPIARWQDLLSDTDEDGQISRSEFAYAGMFPVLRFVYFEMLDGNHDARLDPQEFIFKHKFPREVFALNADGSGWRKLFAIDGFPSLGSPAVSPDGKRIALDGHGPKRGISEQTILITEFDGSNLRQLGLGMMPTWSKDGKKLSYSQGGIQVIHADGSQSRSLTDGWGAQWSPDGRRIAYYLGLQILTVDTATQKKTAIYDAQNQYRQIYWNMAWSPDSQRICFKGSKADGSEEIASIFADPENPRLKVHYLGKGIVPDFAWHPDAKRVVFSMPCPERGVLQLYEFNPDTNDPPQLVKGQDPSTANSNVCWTPDGKQLIVIIGNY